MPSKRHPGLGGTMSSIKLFKGEFGHISVLNVARDLVTHAHPEAHVIVWLEGNPGRMQVGEICVDLGPDTAVGINSFQPHSHSFDGEGPPGSFLAFYIEPQWICLQQARSSARALFRNAVIKLDNCLRQMIATLCNQLISPQDYCDLAAYEIERLTGALVEALVAAQSAEPSSAQSPRRVDHRIRKAIELMQSEISGRIGLDRLARSVGLSRPHFYSLFKEQMDLTPNVFWNTLRMAEALRLVEESDASLTDVACDLGFTTQGNFTRFFRDHAGVPPALYREAARSAG